MEREENGGLSGLQWSCVADPPREGWGNMARDHGMALAAREGRATIRFYRWDRPTVSFGRNEPALVRYRAVVERGFSVVRRPTGGRAVLHDRELTYAVVVPRRPGVRLRTVYRMIQEGLLSGLAALGVKAESAAAGPAARPDAGPCFVHPAEGEIVVSGRKLLGSAQARIQGALLQQGSLLISNDQFELHADSGTIDPRGSRATTLESVLGRVPEWTEVAAALTDGLAERLNVSIRPRRLTESEIAAENSIQARYRSEAWTWRC
ncbi:MAG: lipoate--protein ligase family protein [Gemmatimonadetes bacterium]|nr:lipoate--protein ligase family protein [Gemmatimonadota bacterium]